METPHPWDRLPAETPKAYAAFLGYIALGARRSVREAARQAYQEKLKAVSSSQKAPRLSTVTTRWLGWSARHKWVSRANARDAWLAQVSDEQIIENLKACHVALTTRAHDFLTAKDGGDFLRASRALALHFPPVQRVADVSERIEDLSELSDAELDRMREIRDAARQKKAKDEVGN